MPTFRIFFAYFAKFLVQKREIGMMLFLNLEYSPISYIISQTHSAPRCRKQGAERVLLIYFFYSNTLKA